MRTSRSALAILGLLCLFASAGYAQYEDPRNLDNNGRTALENARPGPVISRSPGRLVRAGVQEATSFGRGSDIGVDISDPVLPTPVRAQLLADSIEAVFDQLAQAIDIFRNLLLARAGRTSDLVIPSSLLDDALSRVRAASE